MSSPPPDSYFPVLSPAASPAGSQAALARLKADVGGVPHLAAIMSASPLLIEAFVALRALFHAQSTFTKPECEIIFLTNAVENGCGYCAAIHTAFARQAGLAAETIDAVRGGLLPDEARLAALVGFNRRIIRQRGRLDAAEVEAFMLAGFTHTQALELLAAAALSTIANYTGRLTRPPLDEFLVPHRLAAPAGS